MYSLKESTTFLYKYCYKNIHNQYVEIFFGYFHRYNSTQNTFIAMDISQFNRLDFQYINSSDYQREMRNNIINFSYSYKQQIKFLLLDFPNEFREGKVNPLPSHFPYGVMIKNINYLYQFDFLPLKDHVVFIEIDATYYKDKKILLSSLEKLKEIEKKYHIDFYIFFGYYVEGNGLREIKISHKTIEDWNVDLVQYIYDKNSDIELWTLQEFLSSRLYKSIITVDIEESVQKEVLQKSSSSGFSLAKDGFANQNRKIESILSPIINSGQVIWLFAPEKIGKTFMAMSIAYAVSKGNCSICGWQSKSSKKVLYIDGEMSGAGLKKIYSKIVRGFQNENSDQVLFDSFLFAETDEEYETILDPIWLEVFKSKLYQYDLIVLDSYYSLNNNSISLKEFFIFLKDLKKHNVALLVIDHTNRNGELQGSIDKRKFTDLGVQLQYGKNKNEISITYEYDRHGITSLLSSKNYYKDFSNEAFKFVEIKDEEKLTREELIGLLEYILYSRHKIKQKELAEQVVNDKNYNRRISENCKLMKRIIENEETLDKYHCNLLRLKLKEFSELNKDRCIELYEKLINNNQSAITINEVKTDSEKNAATEIDSTPIDNKEK